MIKKIIQFILLVAFTPIFCIALLFLLISPIMAVSEIIAIIQHEAPKENVYFIFLIMISLTLYLSMRVSAFRKIYGKFPVLWPLSQMLFISLTGLAFGVFFMNLWAENEIISKPIAIIFMIVSLIVARLFMSYWYRKNPISTKMFI
ncbi:hypothetical protein [Paenibacillus montanisoli]|uniref:Uncharacterized protein n=1 Tax=Paenibacillus montanisoli TaxID=2081970 RepID=A0A328U382_9BACL|nr:hypothetical protein [Paenibacillus montanisoli]RAP74366.1 hypothetical protein DL346_19995 [Paenibacillus montanisoli]